MDQPFFALLQSWAWGEFKEKLGWIAYRVAVRNDAGEIVAGAQMLVKPFPLGLSIAYVPHGPAGAWLNDDAAHLLFNKLKSIARKNGAIFLKIEPAIDNAPEMRDLLKRYQFRKSRINNQPQSTILVNLNQEQDEIFSQMRRQTRRYIRSADKEGITVRSGDACDLPTYLNLMGLTGRRKRFAVRNQKYYQSEWETLSTDQHGALLLAYYQGQVIAARVIYCFGSHAAEFHAGSVVIPGLHPNYLLAWEGIKWAQSKGCVTYDMWGIPDEVGAGNEELKKPGVSEGLWGVYQFKRGFSTNIVSYIGAYDCIFAPGLYFLLFNSGLSGGGRWWERIAAVLDR
jgi:lipid II:glycine glycyltransferase (peptidoglycan interpeptide bridge formation enzyme)